MELKILSISKTEVGKKKLPVQFSEKIRPDLIKKAVEIAQANKRQRYGADPRAGKEVSANISRKRHDYKGSYGYGISRVPRKILSRRGTRFSWTGALAPGTVGGRRAHPPKSEKVWKKKMNKKEKRKAIRSALAATIVPEIVKQRGHKIPEDYPFIVEAKIEEIDKTKKVQDILRKMGFGADLKRASAKNIRAGKGKSRGRRYKKRKGPLIVVSGKCRLLKTAKNIAGVDTVAAKNINAEILAPGSNPGRCTIFTDKAIEVIEKNKMFME